MAFNPVKSFSEGFTEGERQRIVGLQNTLSGQIQQGGFDPSESLDFQKLSTLDPGRASSMLDTFGKLSDSRKKAYHEDLQEAKNALIAGDGNRFLNIMDSRLNSIQKLKGDPSGTQFLLDKFNQGAIPELIEGLTRTEEAGIQTGFLPDPLDRQIKEAQITKATTAPQAKKEQRTATQKDFSTFQDLLTKAKESGDPKDQRKAERFGRAARFIRETEQEKADIKVTQKEREAVAKANVARKQGFINSGIESANGAANVRRALNLLDEVATGGFDNLALKAKRFFGVEGANEGELSNLMGKAVLAQLKPIFGAAFTAREGDALAEIEAKFSNSTANNKRLLENALKLIDRAARRGIAAAENQGDQFTANEIRDALSFNLDDKITEAPVQAGTNGQTGTIGRFQVEVQQ